MIGSVIMSTKRSNDGRHLDAQSKEAIRLRAVDQIAQGESPEAMAEALGVNRRTVYRWLERAHHGGREALYNRAKSGRPTKQLRKRAGHERERHQRSLPRRQLRNVRLPARDCGLGSLPRRQLRKSTG